jgi:hypothetical protein
VDVGVGVNVTVFGNSRIPLESKYSVIPLEYLIFLSYKIFRGTIKSLRYGFSPY